ncbi:Protein phosphatase 2C 2, partial [Lunasporangiospora selenospora]
PSVARYCGSELHKYIVRAEAFEKGNCKAALKSGFLTLDQVIREDPNYHGDTSGCTAITATITKDNVLYVGNAGDSRAVLCSDGSAFALSSDHKPVNIGESRRIVVAGGFVESGRVNGSLALSRAFGDYEFKTNAVLGPEDQIVTGIWDCMSSQEVATFVRKGIADKFSLDKICEMTMDHCLSPDSDVNYIGCDNMTIVIVAILNGKTVEEWYDHIAAKVATRLGPADPSIKRLNGDEDPETIAAEEIGVAPTESRGGPLDIQ